MKETSEYLTQDGQISQHFRSKTTYPQLASFCQKSLLELRFLDISENFNISVFLRLKTTTKICTEKTK